MTGVVTSPGDEASGAEAGRKTGLAASPGAAMILGPWFPGIGCAKIVGQTSAAMAQPRRVRRLVFHS